MLAVDRDPVHLRMAAHNAGVYDVAAGACTRAADVRDIDLGGHRRGVHRSARRLPGTSAAEPGPGRARATSAGAGARAVPAARAAGRLRPGDSEPPLEWCFALTGQVPAVVVKAAPGLPAGIVPAGWETEFVADGRDLKEAVLWSPALATARSRATILPEGHALLPGPGKRPKREEPGGEEPCRGRGPPRSRSPRRARFSSTRTRP